MSRTKKLIILLTAFWQLSALAADLPNLLQVKLIGLSGDLQENADARIHLLYEQHVNELKRRAPSDAFIKQLKKEVKIALEPYGYFKTHVKLTSMRRIQNYWEVTFTVDKGQPLRITHIDLKISGDGSNNLDIKDFLKHFPLKTNDIFTTNGYESAKSDFFQVVNNEGYIRAFYQKSEVDIDLDTYKATVVLHVATGPRFYVGNITFNESVYSKEFLARFMTFKQGDPFSNQKILALEQKMVGSPYFQQVNMVPDFNQPTNDMIPIDVSVTPPKSKRYTVGIGYGTFTGPRLTASASLRRITNTGQHLDVQLRLSSVLSGLSGKYYIPGRNPLTDNWIIGANYQRFLPGDDSSTSQSIFGGYSKKTDNWQFNTNLTFLTERYYTASDEKTRNSKLLYPNATLSYTDVDDLLNPTSGKYLSLMIQGTPKALLSSTSFTQTDLKAKYLFSPFSFAKIIARGEFGYTVVKDLEELPLTMRFFAGGLSTIRGFKDSTIGPGRYLEVASLEYQNKLMGNFWGSVFYDTGTASNHFGTKLNTGVGVGLIYNSVIGNIKVYFAEAISKDKKPYSVELSIGPDFS